MPLQIGNEFEFNENLSRKRCSKVTGFGWKSDCQRKHFDCDLAVRCDSKLLWDKQQWLRRKVERKWKFVVQANFKI
jgi:hypothetical protein